MGHGEVHRQPGAGDDPVDGADAVGIELVSIPVHQAAALERLERRQDERAAKVGREPQLGGRTGEGNDRRPAGCVLEIWGSRVHALVDGPATRILRSCGPRARAQPPSVVGVLWQGPPQLFASQLLKAVMLALQPDVCSWLAHDSAVAWSVVAVPPGQMHDR